MTKKNAIMNYSMYTKSLTKALKLAGGNIHCRVNDEDETVYICTKYFLAKMTVGEYDVFVRPVTKCDVGNWIINAKSGEKQNCAPMDMAKMLNEAAGKAKYAMDQTPLIFRSVGGNAACYYSKEGNFAMSVNIIYNEIHSGSGPRKAYSSISPMVFYTADEPAGMILPVRIDPCVSNAVREYFNSKEAEIA